MDGQLSGNWAAILQLQARLMPLYPFAVTLPFSQSDRISHGDPGVSQPQESDESFLVRQPTCYTQLTHVIAPDVVTGCYI